jgi:hypothetical protein
MRTNLVLGLEPNYIQPTLGITPLTGGFLSHSIAGANTFASNSTTDSFVVIRKSSDPHDFYPTNPLSYETSLEVHSQLASIFIQYDIKDINSKYISDYLRLDNDSKNLLKILPELIKSIFGEVLVAIKSLTPIEVGDQLLEVKIASELTLDDEFDRNEKNLFSRIDALSLASALGNVVITYA